MIRTFCLQVVMINNSDISSLTHDQVVNCIRAAREKGQLILAVKQVTSCILNLFFI